MKFETFSNRKKNDFIKYIINNETIFMAHGVICDVFTTFKSIRKMKKIGNSLPFFE